MGSEDLAAKELEAQQNSARVLSYIKAFFSKMQGAHGSPWINKWATGQQVDGPDGKRYDYGVLSAINTWHEALLPYHEKHQWAHAVPIALSLPVNQVDLPTFKRLLGDAPIYVQQLPAPSLTPEQIKARQDGLAAMKEMKFADPGLDWARKIKTNYQSRSRSYPHQSIEIAASALGEDWRGWR